ncbi:MAG: zinc ribbon domain-containing protein, partial [Erysipelotrichaceae bacterium]|nr:zinc ribbon domain-containing protein [Erysipelotrichaceae bacterium]
MEINAYVCPQCGAPLQVAENATFTTCPKCGCNLKISYSNSENVVPPENRDVRKFVTSEGVYLGTAVVPQNYEVDAVYEALWRSEMVPIYYGFKATRNDHSVFMAAYSKELFHDIRNAFLKGMIKLVDAHARSGYEKFIEPDAYLIKEANKIAGVPLT